ncbi:MAG TPA: DNA primase [Vicinamibacterales bacterium]|jgi:DNA primase|nr:DNA primase [Vicinamibacterales bacterium]
MALFPQHFIDDLKNQADIVAVIQDYVSLKKAGANYKGLCPFHAEKTPSFQVNRDKGFFYCYGCGVGGDVFKFLELHEKVGFQDAVRLLAQRFGMPLPEMEATDEQRANTAEREALLKVHEAAAAWFRAQLATADARIRNQLADRGIAPATIDALGLGYAPTLRDGLRQHLLGRGFSEGLLIRGGLVVQRDNGSVADRFRNRLMIPICRETGSVIAFGGRAVDADQQPKYLNSPETPVYVKSRTLYGLNLSKAAIREGGFAVLVEGYFDFAQVYQAGFQAVVASCGTALTAQQAQLLRRFTSKVVLNFDPDTAGQGAAAKSSELLVSEGFDVNVALLPSGEDPDTFVRRHGPRGYADRLRMSRPYLEYLLDRAAAGRDLTGDEGRRQFLSSMLSVAARIPDSAARDQFADRLAHKARITEEVVRAEIRKAAVARRTTLSQRELPNMGQAKQAEKALIWALFHSPEEALAALDAVEAQDLEGLATRSILELARDVHREGAPLPSAWLGRLSVVEAQLAAGIAADPAPPVLDLSECVREFKRLRYDREQAALQREINRLQELGATAHGAEINALWARKLELLQRIGGLI